MGEVKGKTGHWMQTYKRKQVYPLSLCVEDLDIEDIAHSLSLQCRFAGHCDEFYSVAQHSVFVANLLPGSERLAGLLHDSSEAYLVDIPRPIKPFLEGYRDIEESVMNTIAYKYKFQFPLTEAVKSADAMALAVERKVIMDSDIEWNNNNLPNVRSELTKVLGSPRNEIWTPKKAEYQFLNSFRAYNGKNV